VHSTRGTALHLAAAGEGTAEMTSLVPEGDSRQEMQ
jgi:hypothetical protein